MFSVLMSLYDKEEPLNLDACLKSLTLQTLPASEVIIVFDGHINEDLNKIVSKYTEFLNIKIKKLPHNIGLGNALNIGMKECNYDIIARMDTDDICRPERFERQISFLNKNKDISLLGAGIIEFDEYGNKRMKIMPTEDEEIKKFMKIKNPFNHMTMVFKKDSIINIGGYKHHLYMEDYNLWLRANASGCKMYNIPDVLVEARVGQQMIMRRRGLIYIKSEIELAKLKRKLKSTTFLEGWIILFIRCIPRLVPYKILNYLYNRDRQELKQ
ncbi:glycosyltransferase [Pluralibacter gergoviae]|nr:glycosyltransferase [Pluralibacter gergoviae]ELK5591844.1 glycosyltransferase [Pluralibacter gergoviae]MDU4432657.1 glycosyltransferase [Pluralibacter gergoviae]